MRKEFSYFEKDGQWFPMIEVELKHAGREIILKALIDSGASFSVFRPEVAEYLNIPIERGKKIYLTGIGGRILGYLHTVAIEIEKFSFPCKIIFSREFTVSFNLLGRDNFFQPFVISFLEKRKKVALKKFTN